MLSPCLRGGATSAARITVCGVPGLSIRYTTDDCGPSDRGVTVAGIVPGFQSANTSSTSGRISARSASPVTTSVALLGWNQRLWNLSTSLRSIDCTAASVEIGRAHVCTPVTNAHLVCRLLLEKNNKTYRLP